MKYDKFLIPEQDGEYVNIYNPKGDIYRGNDTESFRKGRYYETWIVNDFSVLQDEGKWHIVGITHPKPDKFINDFEYEGDVHEAEYQLFHCVAEGKCFGDVFYDESFSDCEKILYPFERENEKAEIWAPHLIKYNGKFNIIYSPQEMRRVVSTDFKNWERKPYLFKCNSAAARDPYIYEENGKFYIIYTEGGTLNIRVSEDMENWSGESILQKSYFAHCEAESPFLMKKDGVYYLLWCMYNGENGCYDNRTLVFASKTLGGFYDAAPITMLKAHAPEIVKDNNGDWYLLSVFYPQNGVNAVKLKWS